MKINISTMELRDESKKKLSIPKISTPNIEILSETRARNPKML